MADSGEECDGVDLGGMNCQLLGYTGGTLDCLSDCHWDVSACHKCGNGVVEEGEQCDGQDTYSMSCQDLGFDGGSLACSDSCTWDTSRCTGGCGNGIVEEGEQCDGQDTHSMSCQDLGFNGGSLACSDSCTWDTSRCTGGCGNGIVEEGESCDLSLSSSGYTGCIDCHDGDGSFGVLNEITVEPIPMDAAPMPASDGTMPHILVATADASLTSGALLDISPDWQATILRDDAAYILVEPCGDIIWAAGMTLDGSAIYVRITASSDADSFTGTDRPLSMHCDASGHLWILGAATKTIYRMDGTTMTAIMPIGGQPSDFATGDMNGDGIDDLAVARSGAGLLGIYLGRSDGAYDYVTARYVGTGVMGIALGDMDSDGDRDIMLTYRAAGRLGVILNQDSGQNFSSLLAMDLAVPASAVIVLHLDGDGNRDLALLHPSVGLGTYLGNGTWSFSAADEIPCLGIRRAHLGSDLNGDGIHDGVLTCVDDGVIKVVEAKTR